MRRSKRLGRGKKYAKFAIRNNAEPYPHMATILKLGKALQNKPSPIHNHLLWPIQTLLQAFK
jgi:hypothetical protein